MKFKTSPCFGVNDQQPYVLKQPEEFATDIPGDSIEFQK